MNYKKKAEYIVLVSVIAIIIGVVLALPEKVGLCSVDDDLCIDIYIDRYNSIAGTIIALAIPTSIIAFITYFTPEQKFNSWLRFSKYYLPIAAILIFFAPAVDSSILGFDKEFMTWLLAGIFFVVSLGIIIFKRPHSAPGAK